MPSAPFLHITALALCLASFPASAQQPSWVDPPGKPSSAKPPSADPARTSVRSAFDQPARSAEQAQPQREAEPTADKPETVTSDRVARPTRMATPTRAEAGWRPARGGNGNASMPTPPRGRATTRQPAKAGAVAAQAPKTDLEEAARSLAAEYLATISGDSMVAAAPRFYGSWVRFHDRLLSLQALIAEKRRFVRRWPERHYEPQGVLYAVCSDASKTCIVRSRVSFDAVGDHQSRRAKGIAEVTLTINLAGERPLIVAESSRVLRRGLALNAVARIMQVG